MNNECMVEARDGLAVLDDVEADTFIGFCEFAYTGDYRSRTTKLEPDITSSIAAAIKQGETRDDNAAAIEQERTPDDLLQLWDPPVIGEHPATEEDSWLRKRGKKKKERTSQTIQISQLWTDFLKLTYEEPPNLISNENVKLVNGDQASAPTIITSLLFHAKIYVFAEKYLVDNLRMLCLRKLHADLRDFHLTLQTSSLILEMLEFTYAHTERKESRDDELRMLVIHYAACKGEILKQNSNLRSLLEANGEMACDLLYKHWGESV
jgi:hypothetical protein